MNKGSLGSILSQKDSVRFIGKSTFVVFIAASIFLSGFFIVALAFASAVTIDFETGYTAGIVNGQNGWSATGSAGSGCAVYDEGVVSNTSAPPSFATQSFRISNAVTSGCFGDQAFAAPLDDSVGEISSTASTFSVGTKQNHFEVQFDIASVVPTSQQSGLAISVAPDRGDGSRMSYLRFEDGIIGINVFFDDVQGTTNPANFVETQVGSDLDRTVAHTIKLTLDTLDGPSNDVVQVFIDGSLVHSGTSWENYYRYDSEASAEQSPRIVKTLLIRAGGTSVPANANNGFIFDNTWGLDCPTNPANGLKRGHMILADNYFKKYKVTDLWCVTNESVVTKLAKLARI